MQKKIYLKVMRRDLLVVVESRGFSREKKFE
jgi:hypothetical protein